MGTRSYIAKQIGDNQYLTIYCQLDGYPEYNGVILAKYYGTSKQIDALLALGDLYCLGEKLTPDSGCHDFGTPQPGVTLAYQRDGGYFGGDATIKTFEELIDWEQDGVQYIYIYDKNGQWLYSPTGNPEAVFRPLKDALENDTVKYCEPPVLEDLLGEDWGDKQEHGESFKLEPKY